MRSVNKVTLIGHVGSEVEHRSIKTGQPVANFSLATNDKWKSGDEWKERTEWHRVVAWGKLAGICQEFVRKGAPVYIEGRIQTREWSDKAGNKRFTTEVIALEINLLGSRDGASSPKQQIPRPPSSPKPPSAAVDTEGRSDFFDDDTDLPF